MDPQPPPNAPAPPPSEASKKSRRRLWLILMMGVVPLVAASLAAPRLLYTPHRGWRSHEGANNAREIHKALFEFDAEYGEFPSASTIPQVQADTSTTIPLGTISSNAYFRQLLAMGLGNEKMFYPGYGKFRKPDDLFDGTRALQKGECGFAYVVGLSLTADSSTPLVIAPVIPGGNRFDPDPFDGKAVVLRIDGSAVSYPIRKDGKIDLGKGDLLDLTKPEWKGKALTIAWPE